LTGQKRQKLESRRKEKRMNGKKNVNAEPVNGAKRSMVGGKGDRGRKTFISDWTHISEFERCPTI